MNAQKAEPILILQHAESEALGTIADALTAAGMSHQYIRTFCSERIPADAGNTPGLVVMGGPMGVYEFEKYPHLKDEMQLIKSFLRAERPILGICLGSQLLAAALGANVRKGRKKEIGWYPVELSADGQADNLLRGLPSQFVGYHWHGDIFDLPAGAVSLASSELTAVQAYRYGANAYGLLFHAEVTESQIREMLNEFADEIREENLDATRILEDTNKNLPSLNKIGSSVFGGWASLIQSGS